MLRVALLLSSVAFASASAFAQSGDDVAKARALFMKAFNTGDAGGVAALYEPDAILMPDRSPQLEGRDAIAAYWKAGLQQVGDLKLTTSKVVPLGADALVGVGAWQATTKGDKPQTFAGKDLLIYRRDGDGWKIAVDIWNADGN